MSQSASSQERKTDKKTPQIESDYFDSPQKITPGDVQPKRVGKSVLIQEAGGVSINESSEEQMAKSVNEGDHLQKPVEQPAHSDTAHVRAFSNFVGKAQDIEWFMFETKIRTIIKELVQPMLNKTEEFIKVSDDIMDEIGVFKRRVEEVEFAMHKLQNYSNDFDSLKNDHTIFINSMKAKTQSMQNEFDFWGNKIQQMED